ncbi:MAG: cyclic nucleotide-binding domain-containing protein [Cyanobacteria bacterium P01_A01_bin.135]
MQKVLFFLSELNQDDINWLIQTGERRDISSGTVLIWENKAVETLYIMLQGTVVVSIAAMGDKEIARLHSGDIVGEMSFVEDRLPSATVKTFEPSIVLALPRAALTQKINQDVGFAARFYRALAILLSSRLRGTVKQLGYPNQSGPSDATPPASDDFSLAEVRFSHLLEQFGVSAVAASLSDA